MDFEWAKEYTEIKSVKCKNLLILGAGQYGTVAKEIARSMDCFDKIDFLDDRHGTADPNYRENSIGRIDEYEKFSDEYGCAVVAIGAPELHCDLTEKLKEASFLLPRLVSPKAYVSPSAQLEEGCIVEPFAVVNSNAFIGAGSILSAGAVVNHNSVVMEYCHIDCNATVAGQTIVPAGTKVCSGEVFRKTSDFFVSKENEPKKPHGPIETETLKYCFEDGM